MILAPIQAYIHQYYLDFYVQVFMRQQLAWVLYQLFCMVDVNHYISIRGWIIYNQLLLQKK